MSRAIAIVLFNAAALLAIATAYVSVRDHFWPERYQSIGEDGFVRKDRLLGHRPTAATRTTGTLRIGHRVIYDVVYTVDERGLRVSPPEPPGDDNPCILFFGGSFTFGEGVEDDQTMPYRVGVLAGGRYAVRNFGLFGYGPHQMLAAIEGGLIDQSAQCKPRYAVYLAINHHSLRAAGRWWWDRYGPRYVLEGDRPIRRGNFHDPDVDFPWSRAIAEWTDLGASDPTPGDIRLFHAIIDRSRALLAEQYPGIRFHILYWDLDEQDLFRNDWDPRVAPVHRLSEFFAEMDDPRAWLEANTYEDDGHPNEFVHDAMAHYVVKGILGLTPTE